MKQLSIILVIVSLSTGSFGQSFTITNGTNCDVTVRVWGVPTGQVVCNTANWIYSNWADLVAINGSYAFTDQDFAAQPNGVDWIGWEVSDVCQNTIPPSATCQNAFATWDEVCSGPQQCLAITCNTTACPQGTTVVPNVTLWGTSAAVDLL